MQFVDVYAQSPLWNTLGLSQKSNLFFCIFHSHQTCRVWLHYFVLLTLHQIFQHYVCCNQLYICIKLRQCYVSNQFKLFFDRYWNSKFVLDFLLHNILLIFYHLDSQESHLRYSGLRSVSYSFLISNPKYGQHYPSLLT